MSTTTTNAATSMEEGNSSSSSSDPQIDIAANVALVRANIEKAIQLQAEPPTTMTPPATTIESDSKKTSSSSSLVRLVAVSKTKPIHLLRQAYDKAQVRVFGENYVQELVEKVPQLPSDVQWHFIGNLQSNKIKLLLSPFLSSSLEQKKSNNDDHNNTKDDDDNDTTTTTRNNNNTSNTNHHSLDRLVLETVSSMKLARKLQKAIEDAVSLSSSIVKQEQQQHCRLKVFVQVNTSNEDSKGGVQPNQQQVVELCHGIVTECPNLQLMGLMTIGAPNDETCFDVLVQCRQDVMQALSSLSYSSSSSSSFLELSMGMSGDYEIAIAKGSTNVRVGSTIFGARDYSNIKK